MTIFSAAPFNLTNGQTADATQVMSNINQIISNGNAGCATNGANSNITSLLGLTTPLPVSEGGTGATTFTSGAPLVGAGASAVTTGLSVLTNSLGGNVNMNNTNNFFDGPSVAQGSTGTWFVSGSVTVQDNVGVAQIWCKLWDGTTVIASGAAETQGSFSPAVVALSGFITSPAGNLRISCRDSISTSGVIIANSSGASKDSTITAFRIG